MSNMTGQQEIRPHVKTRVSMFRTNSKGKANAQGLEILRYHGMVAAWEFVMADNAWKVTLVESGDRRPVETMSTPELDAFINGALAMYRAIRDSIVTDVR